MAGEEVPAGRELAGQLPKKPDLGRPVKIDDDVAAKDDLRQLRQVEIRIHEVEPSKLDEGAHFGNDPKQIRVRIADTHEVLSPEVLGNRSHQFRLVDSHGGLGQYGRADIASAAELKKLLLEALALGGNLRVNLVRALQMHSPSNRMSEWDS
jgi:hypothetical protein